MALDGIFDRSLIVDGSLSGCLDGFLSASLALPFATDDESTCGVAAAAVGIAFGIAMATVTTPSTSVEKFTSTSPEIC